MWSSMHIRDGGHDQNCHHPNGWPWQAAATVIYCIVTWFVYTGAELNFVLFYPGSEIKLEVFFLAPSPRSIPHPVSEKMGPPALKK